MPRLPQPGSDNGTWGTVLNDFLVQAHNTDGSLKDIPQSKVTDLVTDLTAKADASAIPTTPGQVGAEPVGLSNTTKSEINTTVSTVTEANLANPESGTTVAVEALIDASLQSGISGLVRVETGTLTNLNTARPNWSGVIDWYINEGDNLPTYIAAGDIYTEVATEAVPISDPSAIFGSSLLGWWDPTISPPADTADYGTLTDRSTHANHMIPVVTNLTDIPQYDADGINGHPAVFHPSISGMGLTSAITWGTGPITVFVGVLLGAATGIAQQVFNGQNNGTTQFGLSTSTDGTSWVVRRGGTARAGGALNGGRAIPHAIAVSMNGDASFLVDNGAKTTFLTPGNTAPTTLKTGFKQNVVNPADFVAENQRIATLFAVNRECTDAEILAATNFLNDRMGI